MQYGSLFAGIGGFDLGFDRAGLEPVWQVEWDTACQRVLGRHWPDVERYGDVQEVTLAEDVLLAGWPERSRRGGRRSIGVDEQSDPRSMGGLGTDRPHTLAAVDVLCGGFPCQDISVAGRRAGLNGDRSGLWFEFARLIAEGRPRWVVIENVPGLLSSNGGRDLGVILGFLGEHGYGFAWRVLDAQWFGVAQRRRRVFIVGHSGAPFGAAAEVLAVAQGSAGYPPPRRQAGAVVAALTANGVGAGGGPDDNAAQAHHLVASTLQSVQRGVPDTNEADGQLVTASTLTGDTATGEGVNPPGVAEQVRRLTPLECERLQGFPDNWTQGESDTTRYRMLGNAVAVPVARWIGQQLMAYG